MSDFANPAGNAAATAGVYVQNLLAVLGDRDPFEVMEQHAWALSAATRGLDDEILRRPEKPGKWSILEVLGHLADTEIVYGYRTRMILAHDTPELMGYDQDRWAERLRYRDQDPDDVLETIRVLRQANLRLLRSLSDEEMNRCGLHGERGMESVGKIIRMIAAHDLVHRRQIERIRAAVAGGATACPPDPRRR